ncbi:hypothetical protein ACFB49_44860 [Sphingomonas sp. DBB INV C78]|uniref:acyl-homoserine-lactone synthase n=1 Tax=Sphingomonas sp. DBB INV C78 TaxID=3349434 RepID=UPI0036D361CE
MHIEIVQPTSRWAHAQRLMQMHHHRKRVFVDELGWELPVRGSWLEVDEFDSDYAVYMMACCEETGDHLGSVRLLPSERPHMFETTFRSLCPDGPVIGPDCWEISRLVCDPESVSGGEAIRVMRRLALALTEFAELNGIRRYTLLAESSRLPALLSMGWDVLPISLPTPWNGVDVQALMIRIGAETLPRMRRRLGMGQPLLRAAPTELAAVA